MEIAANMLYLSGDMDMEEKLNWIDQAYLSDFDYSETSSEIRSQKPVDKMEKIAG